MYIRKGSERGAFKIDWLNSKHSFSFGSYYDPQHMGHGVLRVINDDEVVPAGGFPTHGHRDMEIISYVTEGALAHKDTLGNVETIPAGDVQLMSAGTGIQHSEFNASKSERVKFFQIWITPRQGGYSPGYAQMPVKADGKLTPLVSGDGRDGSLTMNQDAVLSQMSLQAEESLELTPEKGYLHVISGTVTTPQGALKAGDALAWDAGESGEIVAASDAQGLWFQLP